jgi:transcriptional regulator with XRE-family HTH domain
LRVNKIEICCCNIATVISISNLALEITVQPPAEVLKKIADTLDTTVDYLISGDTDEKAALTLKDAELLQQFRAVEQMDEDDKSTVKKLIDAFITKKKIQQLAL